MVFISILFVLIGLAVGFFVGKGLLTPLLLPVAHAIDEAAGFAISRFFRKLFLSANESEFILDGDPLKLPVMVICILIAMGICEKIFSGIADALKESKEDSDSDSQ